MNKKSDRPILVYRFSSLGDIAMTVPVLRSFFNSYPNQKIIFVSRPYASPLFEEFDNLEFIPIDLNNNYKGIGGLFSLFRKLYGKRVRAVVDLHGVLRTKILNLLFRLTFTKVKSIDKGRAERKKLIRKKNKIFNFLLIFFFPFIFKSKKFFITKILNFLSIFNNFFFKSFVKTRFT